MAARQNPIEIALPVPFCDEIEAVSRRTHRSIAFVVQRALLAGADAQAQASTEPQAPLLLTLDEDDPANLLTKIKAAGKTRPLDEALRAAWAHSREKFLAWAAREEAARQAEVADELDAGLRDAQASDTGAARLRELAQSPYPRVRELVAAHPAAPADVLAALANDREPVVRTAVSTERSGRLAKLSLRQRAMS